MKRIKTFFGIPKFFRGVCAFSQSGILQRLQMYEWNRKQKGNNNSFFAHEFSGFFIVHKKIGGPTAVDGVNKYNLSIV